MLDEALLEEGYARVATSPHNVRDLVRFRVEQTGARASQRGVWWPFLAGQAA